MNDMCGEMNDNYINEIRYQTNHVMHEFFIDAIKICPSLLNRHFTNAVSLCMVMCITLFKDDFDKINKFWLSVFNIASNNNIDLHDSIILTLGVTSNLANRQHLFNI